MTNTKLRYALPQPELTQVPDIIMQQACHKIGNMFTLLWLALKEPTQASRDFSIFHVLTSALNNQLLTLRKNIPDKKDSLWLIGLKFLIRA